MDDLDTVTEDCALLKQTLFKYGFQESNMTSLIDGKTSEQDLQKVFKDRVFKRLYRGKKAKPPENYLVIFLFACHGFLKAGTQHILINEYDHSAQYYKMIPAEAKLRNWAETFPNSYIVGIFACCRQLWKPNSLITQEVSFTQDLNYKLLMDQCEEFHQAGESMKEKIS